MNKWKTVLVHFFLWLFFILLAAIIGSSYVGFDYFSRKVIVFIFSALFLFYISYSYLIPKYYQEKRYVHFYALTLLLMLSFSIIRYLFEEEWVSKENPAGEMPSELLLFLRYLISNLCVIGVAMAFSMIAKWRQQEQELYKWKALKNETELKFLKNQLRPHFLFNSINNIYSIAVDHNDKSAPLLLELSQLLRYLIYKTDQNRIPIEEEVHFINSLINLYSLRYDEMPFHEVVVEGQTDNISIPPLIMLPFIENIFKHGDFEQKEALWLVKLCLAGRELIFETTNPVTDEQQDKEAESGIGLTNLQSRLELLFPNAFSLTSYRKDNLYHVILKIQVQ